MTDKIKTGKDGEMAAEQFLKKCGYKIVERNYRTRSGEIDLIALDNKVIVFVEVKTRTQERYGTPAEAVDSRKQSRMIAASEHYLNAKQAFDASVRFDVVSVIVKDEGWEIELIKDAFGVDG